MKDNQKVQNSEFNQFFNFRGSDLSAGSLFAKHWNVATLMGPTKMSSMRQEPVQGKKN